MDEIIFNRQQNFKLLTNGWGEGTPVNVMMLLDSVILDFYSNLESSKIPTKPVLVANSHTKIPSTDHPEIFKLHTFDTIFLSSKDLFWSQYSYQFAHELCHHVIDSNFFGMIDQFGWFEESLCELASIYTLDKMSSTWLVNPPYPSWQGYSSSLKSYNEGMLNNVENKIERNFPDWLSANLPELSKDRYKRTENRIVAINLFSAFKSNPTLWQTIQYIKMINVTTKMELRDFFREWRDFLPDELRQKFEVIEEILFGEKIDLQRS